MRRWAAPVLTIELALRADWHFQELGQRCIRGVRPLVHARKAAPAEFDKHKTHRG